MSRHSLRCIWCWVASLIVLGAMFSSFATACTTPVYRYAMYRWLPAPYEIYFIHEGTFGAADQQVHDRIVQFCEETEKQTNISFQKVNAKADPELKDLPRDVRRALAARKAQTLPVYLIFSPGNRDCAPQAIHVGPLTVPQVDALVESPVRQALAKRLIEADAGVMLLLEGKEATANAAAEKEIKRTIAEVAAGKVELYVAPAADSLSASPDNKDAPRAASKATVGYVRVSRDDAQEQSLVQSLLAVESDLKEIEQPMVFLVYGRGRAHLPCVGKGITFENLSHEVQFITDACSCTVKDQNPGMDLPIRFDWETAAVEMAKRFHAEEGSKVELTEVLPLLLPGEEKLLALAEPAKTEVKSQPEKFTAVETKAVESKSAVAKPAEHPQPQVPAAKEAPAKKPMSSGSLIGIVAAVGIGLLLLAGAAYYVNAPSEGGEHGHGAHGHGGHGHSQDPHAGDTHGGHGHDRTNHGHDDRGQAHGGDRHGHH